MNNAAQPVYRRGFSLLEMLIAVVILGLGLILVATMYPVAWSRARELSEFSTERAVNTTAVTTVKSLARVAKPETDTAYADFAGDYIYDAVPNGLSKMWSDTRVHCFHLQNISYPGATAQWGFVDENPWQLEQTEWFDPEDQIPPERMFETSRIRFEERVYPPLPIRASENFASLPDPRWDDLLNERRYSWTLFHQLLKPAGPQDAAEESVAYDTPAARLQAASSARSMRIFIATLRRSSPTRRYAQQLPSSAPDVRAEPTSASSLLPVSPVAMAPAAQDVMFPVPWRVQILVPDDLVNEFASTGLPTEVQVPAAQGGPLVADMFTRGTVFIDEVSGNVFRVARVRRTVDGSNNPLAFLTLDREMFIEDVDWDTSFDSTPLTYYVPRCEFCTESQLDAPERVRTVWVFPPAVLRDDGGNFLGFDGPQPVVGIETETITIAP